MKYLLLILLLSGCTEMVGKKTGVLTKEQMCRRQAAIQCMDIGDEDESERDFCKEGAYKECMEK